jgi:hypothetical protein
MRAFSTGDTMFLTLEEFLAEAIFHRHDHPETWSGMTLDELSVWLEDLHSAWRSEQDPWEDQ